MGDASSNPTKFEIIKEERSERQTKITFGMHL
jgi:hypothetical protein